MLNSGTFDIYWFINLLIVELEFGFDTFDETNDSSDDNKGDISVTKFH